MRPAHFARDLRDVGLDERVLGRGVAAALQPEHQRAGQHQRGHADTARAGAAARLTAPRSRCGGARARGLAVRRRRCGPVAVAPSIGDQGLLHARQQPHQLRALLRREIGERVVDRRLGDAPDAPVHPLGFRREVDALDAPVAVLRAALDPALGLQPVDHAAGARLLDLHHVGELGLRGAGVAVQAGEHQPLRARDAEPVAPGDRTPCASGARRRRSRRRCNRRYSARRGV